MQFSNTLVIRDTQSTCNCLGRFASLGTLYGSNQSGPPAAKSEAYTRSLSSLWYYRFRPVRSWLLPLTARQPFAYMLAAIWQTAWRKRRLQRRRYNAHVSLIRHETSRRVFERRFNDRGRCKRQSNAKGANTGWDRGKRRRPLDTECPQKRRCRVSRAKMFDYCITKKIFLFN